MDIQSKLVKIAQQAASDDELLAAIQQAHTEAGKNNLEQSLRFRLSQDVQETLDRSDLVSDFFTVFG
jgi:hypothetical protein